MIDIDKWVSNARSDEWLTDCVANCLISIKCLLILAIVRLSEAILQIQQNYSLYKYIITKHTF